MAIKITDECINCGACEPECHTELLVVALRLVSLATAHVTSVALHSIYLELVVALHLAHGRRLMYAGSFVRQYLRLLGLQSL